MQDAGHKDDDGGCDCGRDHDDEKPWSEIEPYLQQYVYDVLAAEAADMVRRGRADMIDASLATDDIEEELMELTERGLSGAQLQEAIKTLRMPIAASIVRLSEAFEQATKLLRDEASRWLALSIIDREYVRSTLARCAAVQAVESVHGMVLDEVIQAALEHVEGIAPSVMAGISSGLTVSGGMSRGLDLRSAAMESAINSLEERG